MVALVKNGIALMVRELVALVQEVFLVEVSPAVLEVTVVFMAVAAAPLGMGPQLQRLRQDLPVLKASLSLSTLHLALPR